VTDLLSVEDAQRRLLASAHALEVEHLPLRFAAGRWVAADVIARRDQPSHDLSAMDGYALRFADLPGPLRVSGESAAGSRPDAAIAPGEAMRIFTGAPLPAGADTVLIQEEAKVADGAVRLDGEGPGRTGQHVRRRGSDFAAGTPLCTAGQRLSPARIALCALGGHGTVAVRRAPRVAIISTGDELVLSGTPTPGSALPSSNAPMLQALLGDLPVKVDDRGIVPDRREVIAQAFRVAAEEADVIVTTGGVSVGDHDLVRPALLDAGAAIDFWRIAIKPGKPLMAGRLGPSLVLGLPGNPVSAYVTAVLFLRPLLAFMMGAASPNPVTRRAELGGPLPATGARAEYLRARLRQGRVIEVASQDSAAVRALADASVLVVRPPHSPPALQGDPADILDLFALGA
jgi:molybdopterin molybdotransferase